MNTENIQGASPIRLEGPLDLYAVAAVRAVLNGAFAAAVPAAIDLGAVTSCDAAGVQLLLAARASAAARGLTLALLAVPPAVAECAAQLGVAGLSHNTEK